MEAMQKRLRVLRAPRYGTKGQLWARLLDEEAKNTANMEWNEFLSRRRAELEASALVLNRSSCPHLETQRRRSPRRTSYTSHWPPGVRFVQWGRAERARTEGRRGPSTRGIADGHCSWVSSFYKADMDRTDGPKEAAFKTMLWVDEDTGYPLVVATPGKDCTEYLAKRAAAFHQ